MEFREEVVKTLEVGRKGKDVGERLKKKFGSKRGKTLTFVESTAFVK